MMSPNLWGLVTAPSSNIKKNKSEDGRQGAGEAEVRNLHDKRKVRLLNLIFGMK